GLPRLREDSPRQRARLQHPPHRPDRPQDSPGDELALRRGELHRPGPGGVRAGAGHPGRGPRRRVRNLALPPSRARAGANGPGGGGGRRDGEMGEFRQHLTVPRALQRFLGPLDRPRGPRRRQERHGRERVGHLRGRRVAPARNRGRVARLADRAALRPAHGAGPARHPLV
ncbi:MAG: Creatinine amidohydrolase, partial [uncultured Thermomicrobiales bacterium]